MQRRVLQSSLVTGRRRHPSRESLCALPVRAICPGDKLAQDPPLRHLFRLICASDPCTTPTTETIEPESIVALLLITPYFVRFGDEEGCGSR